jgi:hypothetical protein
MNSHIKSGDASKFFRISQISSEILFKLNRNFSVQMGRRPNYGGKKFGCGMPSQPHVQVQIFAKFLVQIEAKMEELFTFLDADYQVRTWSLVSKRGVTLVERHSQRKRQTL